MSDFTVRRYVTAPRSEYICHFCKEIIHMKEAHMKIIRMGPDGLIEERYHMGCDTASEMEVE